MVAEGEVVDRGVHSNLGCRQLDEQVRVYRDLQLAEKDLTKPGSGCSSEATVVE